MSRNLSVHTGRVMSQKRRHWSHACIAPRAVLWKKKLDPVWAKNAKGAQGWCVCDRPLKAGRVRQGSWLGKGDLAARTLLAQNGLTSISTAFLSLY